MNNPIHIQIHVIELWQLQKKKYQSHVLSFQFHNIKRKKNKTTIKCINHDTMIRFEQKKRFDHHFFFQNIKTISINTSADPINSLRLGYRSLI